jgi:hypothetical protein
MTNTVQELALQYADFLVRWHELNQHCIGSVLVEDHQALREAQTDLFVAQDNLNAAARRQAELNFLA